MENTLESKAAIFLEENGISGDTMVQCDASEHKGWVDLHDIMADFVREVASQPAKTADAEPCGICGGNGFIEDGETVTDCICKRR